MLDASESLVLCSNQPIFLRSFGGRLARKCRLIECYSVPEAIQSVQRHQPAIALLDLRKSESHQFDRSWVMAHNSQTTFLVVVTNPHELNSAHIPEEIVDRVIHLELEDLSTKWENAISTVEKLLQQSRDSKIKYPHPRRGSPYCDNPHCDSSSVEPATMSLADQYQTHTPTVRDMLNRLEVAARHDVAILLVGETGSGKTHLAKLIHESSSRRLQPLITVTCGAVPNHLIASELFGHTSGTVAGAHADKDGKLFAAKQGTILLKEIDALSADQQVKLLRVIEQGLFEPVGSEQTQQSNARIIAASNFELQPLVEQGHFRPDLYYRLNTLSFQIPPLRERTADIEPLARNFVRRHATEKNLGQLEITEEFLNALIHYPWPGNVREMDNAIRSAVIYHDNGRLTRKTLPPTIIATNSEPKRETLATRLRPTNRLKDSLGNQIELTEKEIIEESLLKHSFSRTQTAQYLGISRVTLYNKMKKHGMMPEKPNSHRAINE